MQQQVRIVSWNVENSFQGAVRCPKNAKCDGWEVKFENTYDIPDFRTRSACFGNDLRTTDEGTAYLIPSGGKDQTWDYGKTCKLKKIVWRSTHTGNLYTEDMESAVQDAETQETQDQERMLRERNALAAEEARTRNAERRTRHERRALAAEDVRARDRSRERRALAAEDGRAAPDDVSVSSGDDNSVSSGDDVGPIISRDVEPVQIDCDAPNHPMAQKRDQHLSQGWRPQTFVFNDDCLPEVPDSTLLPLPYFNQRMESIVTRLVSMIKNGIAALQETDAPMIASLQNFSRRLRSFHVLSPERNAEQTLTFVWDSNMFSLIKSGGVKLWPVKYQSEGYHKDMEFAAKKAARYETNRDERNPAMALAKTRRTKSDEHVQVQPRLMLWALFRPKINNAWGPTLLVGNVHFKGGMDATHKFVAYSAFENLRKIAEKEGATPIMAGDLNDYWLITRSRKDEMPLEDDSDETKNAKRHPIRRVMRDVKWFPTRAVDRKSTDIDRIGVPYQFLEDWKARPIPETLKEQTLRVEAEKRLERIAAHFPQTSWRHHRRGQHRLSDHAPVVMEFTRKVPVPAKPARDALKEHITHIMHRFRQMRVRSPSPERPEEGRNRSVDHKQRYNEPREASDPEPKPRPKPKRRHRSASHGRREGSR